MKKLLISVAAVAALAFAALPASAGDVAVVIHSDAWNVDQDAAATAVAPIKATADAANIAALSDLDGEKINFSFVHADATGITQVAKATAEALGCGGCGKDGVANAAATNVAGLANIDVLTKGFAYVHTGASALRATQDAVAKATGGKNAAAAATNLAGGAVVSVNVE